MALQLTNTGNVSYGESLRTSLPQNTILYKHSSTVVQRAGGGGGGELMEHPPKVFVV